MNKATIGNFFGKIIVGVAVFMLCQTAQVLGADPGTGCYSSDGTFNNANWTATKQVDTTSGASATFSSSQLTAGGNLTSYRRTVHTYGNGAIIVAHLNNGATYTPNSQGAIATVGYSYDLRHFNPPANQAVGYRLLVFQNNTFYGGPMDQVFTDQWQLFTKPSLTAANFTRIAGSGALNPDFSCTGTQITFGYITANSNPNAGTTSTRTSGIDNWCVRIVNAPPPPPLNPDFTLIATINSGNASEFFLEAIPAMSSAPSFAWRVVEIDASGNEITGTVMDNPSVWWSGVYVTNNNFTTYSYDPINKPSPLGSKGLFKQGKTYRITRGVWGPCNPWKSISKTVFMCVGC